MAIDLGPHGVRVNVLGQDYFKTELTQALVTDAEFTGWISNRTPAGRWGDVEDLVVPRCLWRPMRPAWSIAISLS